MSIRISSLVLSIAVYTSVALAQMQTVTYTYTGNPVAIPSEEAEVAAVAEIYVPQALVVSSVTARVFVEYPNIGDLEIALFSARGTRTLLLDNDCGALANVNTTFDDAAPTEYDDFCPAEPGRGPFRGDQPLANSRNELSAGYWTLSVLNNESDTRTGFIRDFSVTITGTVVTQPTFNLTSVVNSARDDSFGAVSPGELVSIYGVALGPTQAVSASSTPVPTTLGGTTVTFDGVAAPILYSSSLQLNVQAPFALQPGTLTTLQVRTSAGTSQSVQLEVVPALAGLYTTQSNGRGQIRAINQNGSINSISNPAPRGSFIALYATGLGDVSPDVNTGAAAPTSPLARVDEDMAVLIGGISTNVAYAGLAPGLVGVYQVNAQIPTGVVPGARSVILLPEDGVPSQGRAFIYVQ